MAGIRSISKRLGGPVFLVAGCPTLGSVGVVVSRQLPQPPTALLVANHQSHLIGRAAIGRSLRGAGVVVSRRSTFRVLLGGGVDREGQNTLLLVEG